MLSEFMHILVALLMLSVTVEAFGTYWTCDYRCNYQRTLLGSTQQCNYQTLTTTPVQTPDNQCDCQFDGCGSDQPIQSVIGAYDTCASCQAETTVVCVPALLQNNTNLFDVTYRVCQCTRGFYGDSCQHVICTSCAWLNTNPITPCTSFNECNCRAGFTGQYCELTLL